MIICNKSYNQYVNPKKGMIKFRYCQNLYNMGSINHHEVSLEIVTQEMLIKNSQSHARNNYFQKRVYQLERKCKNYFISQSVNMRLLNINRRICMQTQFTYHCKNVVKKEYLS